MIANLVEERLFVSGASDILEFKLKFKYINGLTMKADKTSIDIANLLSREK